MAKYPEGYGKKFLIVASGLVLVIPNISQAYVTVRHVRPSPSPTGSGSTTTPKSDRAVLVMLRRRSIADFEPKIQFGRLEQLKRTNCNVFVTQTSTLWRAMGIFPNDPGNCCYRHVLGSYA
jgi:hypothetical protein